MSDYNAANNPMAARPIPQEEQPVQQFKPFEPQPSPDQAGVTVIENARIPRKMLLNRSRMSLTRNWGSISLIWACFMA